MQTGVRLLDTLEACAGGLRGCRRLRIGVAFLTLSPRRWSCLGVRGGLPGIDMGRPHLAAAAGPIEAADVLAAGAGHRPHPVAAAWPGPSPGLAAGAVLAATDELRRRRAAGTAGRSRTSDTLLGPASRRSPSCASPASSPSARHGHVPPVGGCRPGRLLPRPRRPWPRRPSAPPPPAVRCGADAHLLGPAPRLATHRRLVVISRHRIRQAHHAAGTIVLADRRFEDGFLLPSGGDGPIHLAAPGQVTADPGRVGPPPGCAEHARSIAAR